MTTARLVPVTTEMDGDELDAEDAWHLVRRHGVRMIATESFVRFRYGDGFTNSRALALQGALAVVPFLLAVTGLAADIDAEGWSNVVAATVGSVSPGAKGDDALLGAANGSERAGELALAFGLVLSGVSMTTAMAQVERGANRIYGIRRDRPALSKYGRAAVLTLVLALPVGLGFALLVAGGAFGDAMTRFYGWSAAWHTTWEIGRWPVGLVLLVTTIAVLLDHSPRRRQPSLTWLALGSAVAVAASMAAAAGLAVYISISGSFSSTYGPLAGIVALLLWSLMSSMGLFYGIAVCAQLEALRTTSADPAIDDPGRPHATTAQPHGSHDSHDSHDSHGSRGSYVARHAR